MGQAKTSSQPKETQIWIKKIVWLSYRITPNGLTSNDSNTTKILFGYCTQLIKIHF